MFVFNATRQNAVAQSKGPFRKNVRGEGGRGPSCRNPDKLGHKEGSLTQQLGRSSLVKKNKGRGGSPNSDNDGQGGKEAKKSNILPYVLCEWPLPK